MSKKLHGTSADALLLTVIKLVTVALGFVVTRLLSEHLSVHDYGTYSQVLLIVSTVTSLTILGMMDGVNYFYCSETDLEKREAYISTIFCLQCIISGVAGTVVLLLRQVICAGFDNSDVGGLLLFAAALPMLQNLLSMLQVLLVSVGKARVLAMRNLVVSLVKLAVVIFVVTLVKNVAVILTATMLLDAVQIGLFGFILRSYRCNLRFRSIRFRLVPQIMRYCVPMAVFIAINTLNRDCDKFLISYWTDTETLAVYSNASKTLPFDIIIASFTTVLVPQITRMVASRDHARAAELYKAFLEIAYVSTGILCCAAIVAAPQLMELLYSRKYVSGLTVFIIYIMVDLLRFTNITLILSAAGKTRKLMILAFGALVGNLVLNVVMFRLFGIPGPALATLITTLIMGGLILYFGAKELRTGLSSFFDWKYLLVFTVESLVTVLLLYQLQSWMARRGIHYLVTLLVVGGAYGAAMLLLHGKRLIRGLRSINRMT